MTILNTSPNGKLRLRKIGKDKAVVELDCHGTWTWCVNRSSTVERATQLFAAQVKFHQVEG